MTSITTRRAFEGTRVAVVSFRLGGTDGVSVAAEGWITALRSLGCDAVRVAGSGPVERIVPGLSPAAAPLGPDAAELAEALEDADVVIVENMLSLPLHLPASRVVASVLRDRPSIVRHFDLPWHRSSFAHVTELPTTSPAWCHVASGEQTRRELAAIGIDARVVRPAFEGSPPPGDRALARRQLGVGDDEMLCLHPVRAIRRKGIDVALAITASLGGTYWLTGPAEEGFGLETAAMLAAGGVRTRWHPMEEVGVDAAYAAADLVLFPSTAEGFGLPPIEAALRCRPVVVGSYPAAEELRDLGFVWPTPRELMTEPDRWSGELLERVLRRNRTVAREHFSHEAVARDLGDVLDLLGLLERRSIA